MAEALTVHRDRESTYQKFSERLFWHGMIEDIKESIKICKSWRRTNFNFSTHQKNNQMVTIVDLLRSPTPQKFLMDALLQKQYLM